MTWACIAFMNQDKIDSDMAERFFNTAGPNIVEENYTLDPLGRFNLSEILLLIKQKRYFVLHAPRQTGKTTCVLALRDYLNKTGDYTAVYANIKGGQGLRNDVGEVIGTVCSRIAFTTRIIVHDDYPVNLFKSLRDLPAGDMLTTYLSRLSEQLPKPLVLLSGSDDPSDFQLPEYDISYVQDVGLIKVEKGKPRRIANAIYKEIILREYGPAPIRPEQEKEMRA